MHERCTFCLFAVIVPKNIIAAAMLPSTERSITRISEGKDQQTTLATQKAS